VIDMPKTRFIQALFVKILFPLSLFFSISSLANKQPEIIPNTTIKNKISTIGELPDSFFYLGGKLGLNHYQHACESWSLDCDKNSVAAGVFAGYQFTRNIAVEAAYIDLGDAKATYLENGNNYQHTGNMKGIELSALGLLPISNDVAAFAKLGGFNWYGSNKGPFNKSEADDWSATVGAGLTYQLSDAWQARFEYQYFDHLGNDAIGGTNAHFTSLGISYQFGRTRAKVATKPQIKTTTIELEEVSFPILFDFDSSELLMTDSLQVVINRLTKYRQAKVILSGYSDTTGNADYNLALSKRRVDSVANYLISAGVNQEQIVSEYYGEQYPVTDNITEEHRHLNRNVRISLPKTFVKLTKEQ
jgi:OOP family OmpA-OmpF porin